MCGIAGILSRDRQDVVRPMTAALRHRGPDGEGYHSDSFAALGHRRLSIIDPEGGAQPLSSPDGRFHLVCNAEIYNSPEIRRRYQRQGYPFKTRTDVEVILPLFAEHGQECPRFLRGMFAFAVWDAGDRALFLCRDHMGQKPLFFAEVGEDFLFASEPKALLASGLVEPRIDLEALWHYMSLRFIPDDRSLFQGVRKLMAGHTLLRREGRHHLTRYWTPSFEPKVRAKEPEVLDSLQEELEAAVRLHQLSDVPVGTCLSGGIDSSLVASIMASQGNRGIPSFTIGVEEASFNEIPFAREVAERNGLDAHVRSVTPDLVRLAPAMIRALDEPADPFGVGVYLVAQLAAERVKVVLTGDGGDETYAGYDRYRGQHLADHYALLPAWIRKDLVEPLIHRVPESFGYQSLTQKLTWMNDMSFHSEGDRYARSLSFHRFTSEAKEHLWQDQARSSLAEPDSARKVLEHFDAEGNRDLVDRMLFTDLMTRVPDHLLTMADRMSMAHSVEARPVFIDHGLVDFAGRLPASVKLRGRRSKYLLRKLSLRYLPSNIASRPKQGFAFPIGLWLRTTLAGFTRRLLAESRFVEAGIFRASAVEELLADHLAGKQDHHYRLWMLINLELWHRIYMEGLDPDSMDGLIEAYLAEP